MGFYSLFPRKHQIPYSSIRRFETIDFARFVARESDSPQVVHGECILRFPAEFLVIVPLMMGCQCIIDHVKRVSRLQLVAVIFSDIV